jgi:hypothetical protein
MTGKAWQVKENKKEKPAQWAGFLIMNEFILKLCSFTFLLGSNFECQVAACFAYAHDLKVSVCK